MENEAPKYASWVPAAGGYVADGKVVSKSPLYDEAGKLRLDVDTSVFGNTQAPTTTQPQRSASQAETTRQNLQNIINAQSPETQKALTGSIFGDMTTANKEGSGVDANPLMTGAGSLGSLNNNTENTEYGPTNTPATHSNIAGEPIFTPVQQAEQELQRAIASGNDFQRMVNTYVRLQNLTGVDYSAEIKNLMRQGQQSVENVDNDYSNRIATAMMRGDTEEVERLRNEQAIWRNTVGYQDVITQKYQTAREELNVDYETTYMEGVKDITGMLMQALPGILNFQYDPTTDMNLQRAQAQVELRMRNNMSVTGMYYSSTTQYAIAQAIGELVPVYQKMAREEAVQNFQLLQQTANFLMNLEETQFNLWKGQLDMKFKANAEKREEIEAAWDKVNQLGYVDNETSAILGIPAGTESYQTRKMYVDKLNQIDAEERNLQQNKALERYQTDLAMEKMERQSELDKEEYAEKSRIDYGYDIAKMREQDRLNTDSYKEKAYTDYVYDSELSRQQYNQNVNLENIRSQNNMNEAANKAYYDYLFSDSGGGAVGSGVLPEDLAKKYGVDTYNKANEYIENFDVNGVDFDKADITGNNSWVADEIVAGIQDYAIKDDSPLAEGKTKNQEFINNMTKMTVGQKAEALINNNSKLYFGKSETDTAQGIGNSMDGIHNLINAMSNQGTDEKTKNELALAMYQTLFQSITEYGGGETNNKFDYNGKVRGENDVVNVKGIGDAIDAKASVFQQGNKAKEDAMIAIINDIYAYDDYPYELKNMLVKQLSNDAYEFARTHDGGYSGLKKKGNWSLINGFEKPKEEPTIAGMSVEEYIKQYNDRRKNEATEIKIDEGYAGDRM